MEFEIKSTLSTIVQRLNNRKRRHVTSHYAYSSHGIVYVMLLLVYGCYLIHSPVIIVAETTISENRANVDPSVVKATNNANQIGSESKIDETEDEYYDDGHDDEYKDLISNKSGKIIDASTKPRKKRKDRSNFRYRNPFWLYKQQSECMLEHHALDHAIKSCIM